MKPTRLEEKYPAIVDLAARAQRRIPHFAWSYLDSGTGMETCVARNRDALDSITLVPRLLQGVMQTDVSTNLFGETYSVPFGIAPVGLTGLLWPRTEHILATTAARHQIPYCLSTVATETPEVIGEAASGMGWFQLYPPRRREIRDQLLQRARAAGFRVLVVTADVPTGSRRERQRRAGVHVPPKINLRTLYHCAIRPRWTLEVLLKGQPRFRTLEDYADKADMQHMTSFIGRELGGSLDWDYLGELCDEWEGPVIVKGILEPAQAQQAVSVGVDGIVVSNHGGRQFDGAPASIQQLPAIRRAVGDDTRILFDSGVRTGLDIARGLALGADFILLGRAFVYAVAALGSRGGDHAFNILQQDLINNMMQLGCENTPQLRERLSTD